MSLGTATWKSKTLEREKCRLSRGQEYGSKDVTLSRDLGGAKRLPIKGARLNRATAKARVELQAMEDLVEEKGEGVPWRA